MPSICAHAAHRGASADRLEPTDLWYRLAAKPGRSGPVGRNLSGRFVGMRVVRPRKRVLVAVSIWLVAGCAGPRSEPILVRGQLDRDRAVIHVCDSGRSYRYIMTSVAAGQYFDHERKLELTPDEPVIAEFYAAPLSTHSASSLEATLGVGRVVALERGICRHPVPEGAAAAGASP